jgi:hypothetical protein
MPPVNLCQEREEMQFLAGCLGTTLPTSTFRCRTSDPRAPITRHT